MGPLALLAIGAAMGLAKNELVDKPKEKRQRKLAAETQRLSPWTGLQAGPIQEADAFGNALQYGTTGAMMGSMMKGAPAQTNINANMATAQPSAGPWGGSPTMADSMAYQPQGSMYSRPTNLR